MEIKRIETKEMPLAFAEHIAARQMVDKGSQIALKIGSEKLELWRLVKKNNISIDSVLNKIKAFFPNNGVSIVGKSAKSVSNSISNIYYTKLYLYLTAFLNNDCSNEYICEAEFDEDIATDALDFDTFEKVAKKVEESAEVQAQAAFERCDKANIREAGLANYKNVEDILQQEAWDVYGPHRRFPNEVECPDICGRLLKTFETLYILPYIKKKEDENQTVYSVDPYDFKDYENICYNLLDAHYIESFYDVYTLYKIEPDHYTELYSV